MVTALKEHAPAPAKVALLSGRGITFRYGDRAVLDGLSFEVSEGEVFGVLGPNGAGKSTLFSILTGLLRPQAGDLLLDGIPMDTGARSLRARLGVVFQAPSLDAKLTAEENLVLGASLFCVPRKEARVRARKLLAFADLADRAGEQVGKLSGGMRRRLELARALIHRPALLFMDEPTTGLDAASFERTWEALAALRREEGLTIVLTTHRPDEAERCDRLAILSAGRVIACETPEALRSRVSGDVLAIEAAEPEALAKEIAARFQLPARAVEGAVVLERDRGHELVPRLVEAFPQGRFKALSMRRPTLADAFLKLTGRALANDENGGAKA